MNWTENIKIALGSIKTNFLRSLLTVLIIAVGIACLVGILTAIDGILYSMSDNFNRMGANSFSVRPANQGIHGNRRGKKVKRGDPIVFEEALNFKESYTYGGARTSVDMFCTSRATIKYQNEQTNPTVRVVGIDDNYLFTSAYDMEAGRNFSFTEIDAGSPKAILGSDIIKTLFDGKSEKAIGQTVTIGNNKYKVVGALKQKGSSSGDSNDRRVFITLLNAKKIYGYADKAYNITVSVANPSKVDDAVSYAIGKMRNIRRLKASEDNDFEIRKSDSILQTLKDMTTKLRIGTIVIAMLTLLGAAIGLMNIMLVTVTERTKEIGVRKALGATSNNVLFQFLTEAVIICIIGGLVGILLGILIGLGVVAMIKGIFVVPWNWMTLGIIVCIVVGIISGLYPALKAAKMDPIESLRYE